MRLFVGTMLSRGAQAWCRACVEPLLRQSGDVLRPIPDGTAHLTHVFCARLEDASLDRFVDAVRTAATRLKPFDIQLGRLTPIPPARSRLICIDVPTGAGSLGRVAAEVTATVERACPGLDVDPAKSAHVTVLRFRKQAHGPQVRAVAHALERVNAGLAARVERIDHVGVYRSTLTEAGPLYEPLCHCAFGGSSDST